MKKRRIRFCRLPFCRYERRYRKHGRGGDPTCDHKMIWVHGGKHLICVFCDRDGT